MGNLGSYQRMTTMAKECGGPEIMFLMLSLGCFVAGYAFKAVVDSLKDDKKVIVINSNQEE